MNQDHPFIPQFIGITRRYIGALSSMLQHTGLDRYYYPLLLVHYNDGIISQQQLANALYKDKVTTARIIDYLTEAEYIYRQQNPTDKREQLLFTTPKAQLLIPEILKAFNQLNLIALKSVSDNDRTVFLSVLAQLEKNFNEVPANEFQVLFTRKDESTPL